MIFPSSSRDARRSLPGASTGVAYVDRGAAAAALAAVNPLLALVPFIETGPGKDSDCGTLLGNAKAKGAVKKQE